MDYEKTLGIYLAYKTPECDVYKELLLKPILLLHRFIFLQCCIILHISVWFEYKENCI